MRFSALLLVLLGLNVSCNPSEQQETSSVSQGYTLDYSAWPATKTRMVEVVDIPSYINNPLGSGLLKYKHLNVKPYDFYDGYIREAADGTVSNEFKACNITASHHMTYFGDKDYIVTKFDRVNNFAGLEYLPQFYPINGECPVNAVVRDRSAFTEKQITELKEKARLYVDEWFVIQAREATILDYEPKITYKFKNQNAWGEDIFAQDGFGRDSPRFEAEKAGKNDQRM